MIENRLKEVIRMAQKLGWISPPSKPLPFDAYPVMQLSEVEKCLLAMVNPSEFNKMKQWCGEPINPE